MRFNSVLALSFCLLAFSCKKGNKDKDKDKSPGPEVAEESTMGPDKGTDTAAGGNTSSPTAEAKPSPEAPANAGGTAPNPTTDLPMSCRIAVDCTQALPELPKATGFKKAENTLRAVLKNGVHRARDVMANQGQDPILIAKFAYTIAVDADIKGEDVDIYMSKGCEGGWEKLGTQVTSSNPAGKKKVVDGVEDTGGYVMVALSKLGVANLAVGRHRFLFVLKGNNDTTELYVEILPKKNAVVVTDIDGTLTAFEEAAAVEILGVHPESHVGASDMIRSFYHRGYNIFYLTARPSFLMAATREWLNIRGFPPGVIHTTNLKTGATGEAAAAFKVNELALLKKNTGIVPAYAFGNKPSDVKAFADAGIPTANSYFYKIQGDMTGAIVNNDYRTLIPLAQAAPSFCP